MRTIQEVFNAVIEAEVYGFSWEAKYDYMCIALKDAYESLGLITREEYVVTKQCIEEYLEELDVPYPDDGTLAQALYANNLPNTEDDLLAIYKDWDDRPRILQE